jgi:hypothetical protein
MTRPRCGLESVAAERRSASVGGEAASKGPSREAAVERLRAHDFSAAADAGTREG